MKAVFISYDGMTDHLGQSQVIPYLIGLKKSGYDYTILSAEKKQAFDRHSNEVSGQLKSHGIKWLNVTYTKKPALFSTLYDIAKMRRKLRRLIRNEKIDVFHCRSYVSMFVAFDLARRNGIKVLFDMRGFWIDERLEGGIWKQKNPVIKALVSTLRNLEFKWFKRSDHIVSLTESGKNVIELKFGVDASEIHVIPCCADEEVFDPARISEERKTFWRNKTGIKDGERILGYVGSLGTWYMADEMMQFFNVRNKEGKLDKFLWLTGEDKAQVYQLAEKYGVGMDKIAVQSASRKDVPALLSLMDYGIFYIRPTFSKTASSPTKLGEMLLMGIPVICNANVGDLDEFFAQHQVGICHDLSDMNVELPTSDKEKIRQIGIEQLGLRSGIDKYINVLKALS